jgi:hypothetical protein
MDDEKLRQIVHEEIGEPLNEIVNIIRPPMSSKTPKKDSIWMIFAYIILWGAFIYLAYELLKPINTFIPIL